MSARTLSLIVSGEKQNAGYISAILRNQPALRIDTIIDIAKALGFTVDQLLYTDLSVETNTLDMSLDADLNRLITQVSKYSRFAEESIYTKPSFEEAAELVGKVDGDISKLGTSVELFDVYKATDHEPFILPLRIGLKGIGFQTYGTTQVGPLRDDISGTLKAKAKFVGEDYRKILKEGGTHFSTQSIDQVIHRNRSLRIVYDRLLLRGDYPGYGEVVLNYGKIRDMQLSLVVPNSIEVG